jgi:hypothetical protein
VGCVRNQEHAMTGAALSALLLILSMPVQAATAGAFETAYAAAAKAEREALAAGNAWTTTETRLESARNAANARHYEEALALAKQAEILAKASLEQTRKQQTAWRESVVK